MLTSARRRAASGWIPAALLVVLSSWCLREVALVPLADQARFAGYLVGWVVLPGTALWRLVDRRGVRPLVEDLALGTLVGYVVETPVYLACLALGHPHGYLLWPVALAAVLLVRARTRRLVLRRGAPVPTAWSWSVAGLLGYVLLWWSHTVWGPAPSAGHALLAPEVDEPYHLSLVAGLKHFFPPRLLFVDDTPLQYHYLAHVHMAAGSWVSGVEPVVVLRGLALPAVTVAVLLALAAATARLSARPWLGPVALAGVLVAPADFHGGTDGPGSRLLDAHLQTSPTSAYAHASMLLGAVLVAELLRRERAGVASWVLTGVTMVVMCGAKAATLPTVVAGLLLATAVSSLAAGRIRWRPLVLTALAAGSFVTARALFFGPSSQGLSLDPLAYFATSAASYPHLAGADHRVALVVLAAVAVASLGALSLGAGLLAGLGAGGWREPAPVFLVGVCTAGYALAAATHQIGFSEGYFILAVQVPLVLGAALGIARHTEVLDRLGGLRLVAVAIGAGLASTMLYAALTPSAPGSTDGPPLGLALRLYTVPALTVTALAVVVTALVLRYAGRERRVPWAGRAAVLALVLVGAGLTPTVHRLPALVAHPAPAPVARTRIIPPGGIAAARALRARAPLDAVVATNAHCELLVGPGAGCTARHFWMAGYSERQLLVEGWAYVSRASVGRDAPAGEDIHHGPFWDPDRLAANDRAFSDPDEQTVDALRSTYGVRWLLVDRAYPVDLVGLRRYAVPVYRGQRFWVLRLR